MEVGLNGLIISTFVDDIKIMTPKRTEIIQRIKIKLIAAFLIVDMGPISFYLDMKID